MTDLRQLGVADSTRRSWVTTGRLRRLGPRSYAIGGAAPTWHMACTAGTFDLGGHGVVAGRAAARLHHLDSFDDAPPEFMVPIEHRRFSTGATTAATATPIDRRDLCVIDGLSVVRPERLLCDAPRFHFTTREIENAIDSAIRLRLVSEQRLRTRVVAQHTRGINGSRTLLDALVDSGGESRLERWFLGLVRRSGLPAPERQVTFRAGSRTVGRVDFLFPGGLVVEVAGHGTHATRRQRQVDAQRHTELTLRGLRVLTFTYEDVRDRPEWLIARLWDALRLCA
jgi:hypothetical protein